MNFTVYVQSGLTTSPFCYFLLTTQQTRIYSPVYPDQPHCEQAIQALISRLRGEGSELAIPVGAANGEYALLLHGPAELAIAQQTTFPTKALAQQELQRLKKLAEQEAYEVVVQTFLVEVEKTKTISPSPYDHPNIETFSVLRDGKEQYFFHINDQAGKTLLISPAYESVSARENGIRSAIKNLYFPHHIILEKVGKEIFFKLYADHQSEIMRSCNFTSLADLKKDLKWLLLQSGEWGKWYGVQQLLKKKETINLFLAHSSITFSDPVSTIKPVHGCHPVFKLLNPYAKEDIANFFGRQQETDDLYRMTYNSRILLLYGEAGVGKTSLVQCGLVSKMEDTRWQWVFIQQEDLPIGQSLIRYLNGEIVKVNLLGHESLPTPNDPMEALHQLYNLSFKRIFLVFDQLERIFEPSVTLGEREEFFSFLQAVQQEKQLPCKVMLIMRDTFMAHLMDYEELIPALLDHRYHLKPISAERLKPTIENILVSLDAEDKIDLIKPKGAVENDVVEKIHHELTLHNCKIHLSCLQIYLHELYQGSCTQAPQSLPAFSPALVDRMGSAEKLIEKHLTSVREQLQRQLPKDKNSLEFHEKSKEIGDLLHIQHQCCCKSKSRGTWLFLWWRRGERIKRLQRLMLLSLLALLLCTIGAAMIYYWLLPLDPSLQAKKENTCEAYLNYLCSNGTDAPFAAEFKTILNEQKCQIWIDYQEAIAIDACRNYQSFINTYEGAGFCTDVFKQRMYNYGCLTDTVHVIDTIILEPDTVWKTKIVKILDPIPHEYEKKTPKGPDCLEIGGYVFKRIGQLWVMTSDLGNDQVFTWLEGLKACRDLGGALSIESNEEMRLPCVGEIESAIADLGGRIAAYNKLTQALDCPRTFPKPFFLGEFWTATESNDEQAWSIQFDDRKGMVRSLPGTEKTLRLPCRCVLIDNNSKRGDADCYDKVIIDQRLRGR